MPEEPWWAPIREALVKKAAEIIMRANVEDWAPGNMEEAKEIIEAEFEDVPAKAPRKRRKALPSPLDRSKEGPSSPTVQGYETYEDESK